MLTLDHLRLIQSEFSGESDANKILDSGLFEGWQLPTSQISYLSDIIEAFDGDLEQAMTRLEADNYIKELTPFLPGFKKTPQKNRETKTIPKSAQEKKKTEKHKPTKSKASQEEGILMATDISNYLDRITDYQLVTAHTPSALNQEVRKEMELYGWIPYGGASVAHAGMGSSLGGAGSYFQAMVKLKKK